MCITYWKKDLITRRLKRTKRGWFISGYISNVSWYKSSSFYTCFCVMRHQGAASETLVRLSLRVIKSFFQYVIHIYSQEGNSCGISMNTPNTNTLLIYSTIKLYTNLKCLNIWIQEFAIIFENVSQIHLNHRLAKDITLFCRDTRVIFGVGRTDMNIR